MALAVFNLAEPLMDIGIIKDAMSLVFLPLTFLTYPVYLFPSAGNIEHIGSLVALLAIYFYTAISLAAVIWQAFKSENSPDLFTGTLFDTVPASLLIASWVSFLYMNILYDL